MNEIFELREGRLAIRIGVFGNSGKGKTHLVCQMMKDERLLGMKYDEIFLINPSYDMEEPGKLWNSMYLDYVYKDFNQELVEQINEYVKNKFLKDREYKALLVLDDCVSNEKFDSARRDALKTVFTNARKYALSVIVISQRLSLVPQTLHSQFNYIILFKTGYGKELKTVSESYACAPKEWEQLLKYIYKNDYDFLFIDIDKEIYYRNFNRLKITHG